MDLNFKEYFEAFGASGRAGQKFWKPETPVLHDPKQQPTTKGNEHIKGVRLDSAVRAMQPAPFKGLTGDKFGIQVKKVPKPHI